MSDIATLIADNLETWTSAIEHKGSAGRGASRKISPYGIDRLRALILDLAVRGKLVRQDPSDKPATELLQSVRKAMPKKAKTIGRLRWKPSRSFDESESARTLPPGWSLARLNDTGFYINGLAFKPADWSGSGTPIIRIQNLTNPEADYNFANGDFPDEVMVKDGDLLVSWSATLNAFQWHGEDAVLNQHIFRVIHEPELTNKAFLKLVLEHAIVEMAESDHAHGLVMTHINRGPFLDHLVSIPPMAEQERIVAKVDELMALCDALERKSEGALTAHQTLVETLLATLTTSTDAAELAKNWARLETHFDTLFTTKPSIDALKQTILDLAVRGKLVEKDAEDEAASELITQWKAAKLAARESLADRRIKACPDPSGPPWVLPEHWQTQSLENLFLFIDYRGKTPPKTDEGVPLITAKNVRMGYLDREPREFIAQNTFDAWMTRGFPRVGDLFFTPEAPLGNVCLNNIDERFAIAQRLICFQPYGRVNSKFYMLVIMSAAFQKILEQNATGMTALGIKAAKLKPLSVPVPPEAEQDRIVAKVDELMALCDALKARLHDAAETQRHLADAIVERAAA